MGRASANAYKSGSRPYGQPAISTAFRDSTPRPQGVGPSRNVHQVANINAVSPEVSPEVSKCKSLTRSGEACKGRPPAGSDLCNFHKE